MKFWSRVTRILLATVVASQGAVFLPAMAASQSKKLAVKAIGIEELQSEYGAGGGSGGSETKYTGPGFVEYPTEAAPLPSCAIDLDSDGYCDSLWYQESGVTSNPNVTAYQRVAGPVALTCNPSILRPDEQYCTYTASAAFGVGAVLSAGMDVNTPLGPVNVGVEVSGSISLELSMGLSVARGYKDTFTIEKTGTRYSGNYLFAYYDRFDKSTRSHSPNNLYSGSLAGSSWSKTVWRAMYPARISSQRWY